LFRRRSQDPERAAARAAFGPLAERLEATQRALLAAVPTARDPGVPLAAAIESFERGLDEVESMMPAWQTAGNDERWHACAQALELARRQTQALRRDGPDLDFEALNARVGDVLEPLEVFADVERELRAG
jgi:hypothetical protein